MLIANPIYDVVFKYLMEDSEVAKLLISSLLGMKVLEIDFRPTEYSTNIGATTFTIYRLDFSAKIETPDGPKDILIELQKAKFPTDIMRFRRYVGQHYSHPDNVYMEQVGKRQVKRGIPVITIYFLGHNLETYGNYDEPVVKVIRGCISGITGKKLRGKDPFIESLTHDSIIVQIPKLRKQHRTELEILLSVFDQSNIIEDHHILNVKEEDFPELYRPLIRRLQKAVETTEVRKTMDVEDEILEELSDKERFIASQAEVLEEKEKKLEEKDQKLEENEKKLEENEKKLEEQARLIKELQEKLKSK